MDFSILPLRRSEPSGAGCSSAMYTFSVVWKCSRVKLGPSSSSSTRSKAAPLEMIAGSKSSVSGSRYSLCHPRVASRHSPSLNLMRSLRKSRDMPRAFVIGRPSSKRNAWTNPNWWFTKMGRCTVQELTAW